MDRDPALPVVVAIDGSGSAKGAVDWAVDWAAAEAAARNCGLRIVHALTVPLSVDPCATGAVIAQVRSARTRADQLLARALVRARSVASDLDVTTALLDGPVTWALKREADRAALLVLGVHTRRTRLGRLVADSVSGTLSTTAACPVVVVRRPVSPVHGVPTVVVGLELGTPDSAALRYAFSAAEQRGVPVTVVDGQDAAEIAEASAGAALLVLASVGRRHRLRSAPSLGRALLAQPGCPVAVVRNGSGTKHTGPYGKLVSWTASSGSG